MNSSVDAPLLLDATRLVWRRWTGRRPTGIDRACLAYLDHFGDRSQAVLQHPRLRRIFAPDASRRLFDLVRRPGGDFRARFAAFVARHGWGPGETGKGRVYLNVGHTGLNHFGFRSWAERSGVRPVYLVHDLIPITHPEFCRAGEEVRHRARMETVFRTGAGIVANSRHTLAELEALARAERIDCPPMVAAWLGAMPFAASAPAAPPDRPTFVVLGTIEGRKNHLFLLNLWSRLVERLGDETPQLLVIGQRGWEAEQAFAMLDRSPTLRGHVVEIGRCGDAELAAHLSGARALLFPSLVEGFGLPVVEALAIGVPVIASDLPVFREIAADLPLFLSPLDGPGWERAILELARPDSRERAALIDRMAGYAPPDWPTHLQSVETWLGSL